MDSTQTTTPTTTQDPFLQQLQQRLLGQGDIISSANTKLETKINDAISNLSAGNEASKKVIASKYDRDIATLRGDVTAEETTFQESGRGYGVSVIAFDKLVTDNRKRIDDLEQRKQELMLQGDATTASKIADLQLKSLEYEQQAAQQVFSNLLSIGNFRIQQNQEERLSRAQSFQEKAAISQIALEYGISVKEGDTIDTITARAAPFASEKQKLELQKTKAEIGRINAETQKVINEGKVTNDPAVITSIAQAANKNPAVLGLLKDAGMASKVVLEMEKLNAPRDFTSEELTTEAQAAKAKGVSYNEALGNLIKNGQIKNKEEAKKVLSQVYNTTQNKSIPSWGGFTKSLGNMAANVEAGIFEFVTGKDISNYGFKK